MGTMPARYSAILRKTGIARSKWARGGLHQPPLSLGWAKFGGQKLVAVTKTEGLPGWHHLGSLTHLISKHAPQLWPLLNNAVLRAAVFVPYPWLYKSPYPHAPPNTTINKIEWKRKTECSVFEWSIVFEICVWGEWTNPWFRKRRCRHRMWHERFAKSRRSKRQGFRRRWGLRGER